MAVGLAATLGSGDPWNGTVGDRSSRSSGAGAPSVMRLMSSATMSAASDVASESTGVGASGCAAGMEESRLGPRPVVAGDECADEIERAWSGASCSPLGSASAGDVAVWMGSSSGFAYCHGVAGCVGEDEGVGCWTVAVTSGRVSGCRGDERTGVGTQSRPLLVLPFKACASLLRDLLVSNGGWARAQVRLRSMIACRLLWPLDADVLNTSLGGRLRGHRGASGARAKEDRRACMLRRTKRSLARIGSGLPGMVARNMRVRVPVTWSGCIPSVTVAATPAPRRRWVNHRGVGLRVCSRGRGSWSGRDVEAHSRRRQARASRRRHWRSWNLARRGGLTRSYVWCSDRNTRSQETSRIHGTHPLNN